MRKYVFFICILLLACKTNKNSDIKHHSSQIQNLDLFSNCSQNINSLSTCFSSIKFIQLDNNFPINAFKINDIFLSDSVFFLMQMHKISKYNYNGSHLTNIGKCGRGPKEFLQLSAPLNIDSKNNQILAYDTKLHKLYRYNFDGKFINSIKFPNNVHSIRKIENNYFAAYQTCFSRKLSSCYQISFVNNKGKISRTYKSKIYPLNHKIESYGSDQSFIWRHKNHFYSYEYGGDTIYQIDKDSLLPRFTVSGKRKLTKNQLLTKDKGNCLDLLNFILKPNSAVFESDQYLLFRLSSKKECFFKIYNKINDKWYRTFHQHVKENRRGKKLMDFFIDDFYTQLKCKFEYESKGKLVGFISAIDIVDNRKTILTSLQEKKADNKLINLFEQVTENSNPIMIIANLK